MDRRDRRRRSSPSGRSPRSSSPRRSARRRWPPASRAARPARRRCGSGSPRCLPDADVVLVHDAARPLLPPELVPRLLEALAEGFDGAVPGLPVTDTVKRVRDGVVVETPAATSSSPCRRRRRSSRSVLRAAAAGEGSDCASLVEAAGGRVKVVPGDERLLKVTTPDDLRRVEAGSLRRAGVASRRGRPPDRDRVRRARARRRRRARPRRGRARPPARARRPLRR